MKKKIKLVKYLICSCGWKSKAYSIHTILASVGGELGCPECTKHKRNHGIEAYGHVKIVIKKEDIYNPSRRDSQHEPI